MFEDREERRKPREQRSVSTVRDVMVDLLLKRERSSSLEKRKMLPSASATTRSRAVSLKCATLQGQRACMEPPFVSSTRFCWRVLRRERQAEKVAATGGAKRCEERIECGTCGREGFV